MIRSAKLPDIPGIVALLEAQIARTHYAGSSVRVDVWRAKQLLMNAIAADGLIREGGCCVKIIERFDRIEGLMLATLQPVYLIGNKLCATNLFWFISERARPTDGGLLMVAMLHWAKAAGAIEAKCDTTAIVSDPARAGKLLERWGFAQYGNQYRLDLEEVAPCLESQAQ